MRPLIPAITLLALAGCDRDPTFEEVMQVPDAAFLSASGTAAGDVWLVGARPAVGQPPTILHGRDGGWTALATTAQHDMWWVQAFDSGVTWIAGAGATILRVEDEEAVRTPTPHFFGNTVYGLWGATDDDIWAVGGFAGRAGFVWRWDGSAWSEVALPSDLPRAVDGEVPALFKVWGRGADDVWIIGGAGTILHWDGAALSVVPSGTTEQLFTVTGDAEQVVVVGGSSAGVVLRGGLDGFEDDTPTGAPLLQGVTVDADGDTWVAGAGGFAARHHGKKGWSTVDLGFASSPASVHALWASPDGDVWAVGGNVLSPALDSGVVATTVADVDAWEAEPLPTPDASCPAAAIDPEPTQSIARRWNEQLLNAIRRDIPHPPAHARNLFHTSMAMFDAWATYQPDADGVLSTERLSGTAEDVDTAISFAAYRVLSHRYANAVGAATSLDCFDQFMGVLALDPSDTHTDGEDAVAVGNRIGALILSHYADDGANEAGHYADTTDWQPTNPVMIVDRVGTNVEDPDTWQQLNLGTAETQNGIVLDTSIQPYLGPHWRDVEPFAITRDPTTGLYAPPEDGYPTVNDPEMAQWALEVIRKTSQLSIDDGVMMDTSPASVGNNPLGTNDGEGYAVNPVTGEPYAPQMAPRGDFTRVVAELWADGPRSETPPGHWATLSNDVSDHLAPEDLVPFGEGAPVDRLAWDVGLYLAVTGATHDAAITAWELKRDSLGPRPITLIRWMGQNGQRSDPAQPSYHEDGIPLEPGLVEVITEQSAAPGERHHHLRWYIGEIAVLSWPGEPGDRANDYTPLTWMRIKDWIPYQRRTFVTPAFPGFISGHSTFSRAAAEVLTAYTGSPWFPGGLFEYVLPQDNYLVFENGPSQDLHLQWASYYDAADQAGQSRLWGGIHIWADDRFGRIAGSACGHAASEKAAAHLAGTAR